MNNIQQVEELEGLPQTQHEKYQHTKIQHTKVQHTKIVRNRKKLYTFASQFSMISRITWVFHFQDACA